MIPPEHDDGAIISRLRNGCKTQSLVGLEHHAAYPDDIRLVGIQEFGKICRRAVPFDDEINNVHITERPLQIGGNRAEAEMRNACELREPEDRFRIPDKENSKWRAGVVWNRCQDFTQ